MNKASNLKVMRLGAIFAPKNKDKGLIIMLNVTVSIEDIEYLESRTKKVIKKFGIDSLMDYTVESTDGCDISDFYRSIVEEVLIEDIYVTSAEISNGKYEITFEFEGKDIWYISSYELDTVEIVVENLMDNVIISHIRNERLLCQNQYIA